MVSITGADARHPARPVRVPASAHARAGGHVARLGIVSDDLTGATTVGALLAHAGGSPVVLFDRGAAAQDPVHAASAVVVSTDSRAMEPEVAFWRVHRATRVLATSGARHFSKRIDTTCRGNIGPEVEGMLTALGGDHVAVIVPAMPASRRIVVDGYSLIDSELLTDTGAARDVRTPVHEPHLPTLFRRQFHRDVAHVPLSVVLRGRDAVAERLRRERRAGGTVFMVDAVGEQHIESIAQAVMTLGWDVVAVDPGPFTTHLAVTRGLIAAPAASHPAGRRHRERPGIVAVVAGSATRATHEQMARLAAQPGTDVFAADILALLGPADRYGQEAARLLRDARAALRSSPAPRVALLALSTVISGDAGARTELERHSGVSGAALSTLLLDRFSALARRFLDEVRSVGIAGVYLTGGDVMASTCRAMDAAGLLLTDYVIPQIDLADIVGGPFDGVPVVCKGGLTGDPSAAVNAVHRLLNDKEG